METKSPSNPFAFPMKAFCLILILGGFSLLSGRGNAQAPATAPAPETSAAAPAGNWKLSKEKVYSLYKVQIFVKEDPNGPKSTRAVILDSKGIQIAEIKDFDVEPDPRETVEGWTGGTLDLDADGSEDLFLRTFSGGAHCCYGLKAYSLGKGFKKI